MVRLEGTTVVIRSNLPTQAGRTVIPELIEQDCVHTVLEYRQEGTLHILSRQSVSLHCNRGYSDNIFSKEQNKR